MSMTPRRVVILGAAGRDFHNFNTVYRDNPDYQVLAFTATQIPGIADRRYPAVLAGKLYPQGIPIVAEQELVDLIKREKPDVVVFGHTHQRFAETINGVLYLNPGYSGKPRQGTERSVALLHIDAQGGLRPEFIPL